MQDWYEKGSVMLLDEIVEETGVAKDSVEKVYAFLNNIGLVDYDNEKEIIWERYFGDDD